MIIFYIIFSTNIYFNNPQESYGSLDGWIFQAFFNYWILKYFSISHSQCYSCSSGEYTPGTAAVLWKKPELESQVSDPEDSVIVINQHDPL